MYVQMMYEAYIEDKSSNPTSRSHLKVGFRLTLERARASIGSYKIRCLAARRDLRQDFKEVFYMPREEEIILKFVDLNGLARQKERSEMYAPRRNF